MDRQDGQQVPNNRSDSHIPEIQGMDEHQSTPISYEL